MSITAGITFLITVITVLICFFVFQSFLKKNQLQSTEFNLQLVANQISADMENIVYLSKWCTSNTDIIHYLETFRDKERLSTASKEDKSLRPLALSAFARLKEEYDKSSRFISRLIISSNNFNNVLQLLSSNSNYAPYNSEALSNADFFDTLSGSRDYQWIGFVDDPFYPGNSPAIVPILRPVYSNFNSDIIGWVYLSVSSDIITGYLKDYPLAADSSLYLSINEHFYQIQDNQLFETDPGFTLISDIHDSSLNPDTKVQTIRLSDGSKRTLVARSLEQEDWFLYQVISEQQLNEQKQVYLFLIFGICLMIFSLGFALMFLLNRTISQPVALVRKKIDDISHGDFSPDQSIEWDHEIGDIGKGINRLSTDVVTLMDKRIEDEKQKKDLEYQILQSQINPHFLYNTLNSIKWMATIQGASGIAEMTTALARLMKNISKGTSTLISLSEELDLVKDYFLIQQYRYGGSITIEYKIQSPELYTCRIHRFSLQPMIENALFHGIEPKGAAGKLLIDAHILYDGPKKNLEIFITDNGIGMTPEMIEKVLHGQAAEKTGADFFKQVGIHNVNRRIQHDFGPDYGITIESVPGEYTTMILLIPYMNEQPEEDLL